MFQKATKRGAYLRMALIGPAGSGKTYTALRIATELAAKIGKRIALMDTEHGSASKYADLFDFDSVCPETFAPTMYQKIINEAARAGYGVLVIDSFSHAWSGKDGALEQVDRAAKASRTQNSFAAWRDVTPMHNAMIETVLAAPIHIIATMRSKTEWVLEDNGKGKKVPRKIGTQPVQRDGVDYEFDVVADLDHDHTLVVGKTRCAALDRYMEQADGTKLALELHRWLTNDGTAQPETGTEQADEQWNSAELDAQVAAARAKSEGPTAATGTVPEAEQTNHPASGESGPAQPAAVGDSYGPEPAWFSESLPKLLKRPNWAGKSWGWLASGESKGDRYAWCSGVLDEPQASLELRRRCEVVVLWIEEREKRAAVK